MEASKPDPATTSVLIVDDERGPRLALQLVLQREFRVLAAESGEQALEILRSEPVDVVTLDLKMPGLAGQNTLSILRDSDPYLPVIVITGYGSFESALRALKLHAFDYIAKPFESERILEAVRLAAEDRRRMGGEDREDLLAPLDAVLEAADWLEHSGSYWLSNPDRAALDCIRLNVRCVREKVGPTIPGNETFDFFAPRKDHG